jgi:hypothetical protein
MIVIQLVKKFSTFYGTLRFTTVFTRAATDHLPEPQEFDGVGSYVTFRNNLFSHAEIF